jgi:hypothetical protein
MSSVEIAGSARKVVGLRGTPKTPTPFPIETKFTEASEIETDTTTSDSNSEAEKTPMEVEPIKTGKETKRKRTRDVAGGPVGALIEGAGAGKAPPPKKPNTNKSNEECVELGLTATLLCSNNYVFPNRLIYDRFAGWSDKARRDFFTEGAVLACQIVSTANRGGTEGLLSIGAFAALLSEFFGVTLGHFSPVEDLGEIWGKVALIRLDLARPESGKLGKVVGLDKLAKTRIFALWRGVSLSVYTVPRVQPESWSARIRISGLPFGLEPSALGKYLAVELVWEWKTEGVFN